jgi:putative glycosyltransferase (TIGR04372 family)
MAEWLASRNIWVLRMGAVVAKPFVSDNPRIIDYASHHRSDFGDIFLLGHCKFFVGDTAGMMDVCQIMHVPVALTNLVPITHLYPVPGSMVMVKKYRRVSEKDFIPYREVVEKGYDGFQMSHQYDEVGIELTENTPEEILDMVQELNARIDGTWVTTPEDEELHARFWSIFPPGHPSHGCPARVPIYFLRRNRDLLP